MSRKLLYNQKKAHVDQDKAAECTPYIDDSKIPEKIIYDTNDYVKLQLHEEQLDITKKRIQTRIVTMHKEVFTEEKTITVSVTREELVIEKRVLDENSPDKMDGHTDIIRIPISEERIEVIKHPVVLEDVKIYKHQFHDTKCIEETLKKEMLHLEIIGNPRIINKES